MYIFSWIFYIALALLSMVMVRHSILSNNNIGFKIGNKKLFSINLSMIALFIILLFFAVMRKIEHGIGGTDAYAYLKMVDNAPTSFISYLNSIRSKNLLNISEPLFKLFNIFCNRFPDSHAVFLLIVYGTIVYNFLYFVKTVYNKRLDFFPIILLICCYLGSFNIIRSWWSASICLLSFCFILDKKYIKALGFIIIASLIHYMGFCFLAVWGACLLYDRKPIWFNRKNLIIVCILVNLLLIIFQSAIKVYVLNTKYSAYSNLYSSVSILGHLPTILICAYSVWNFDYYKKNDDKTAKCAIAMTVNLSLIFAITALLAWRVNDYFAVIRIYMISNFFYLFKGKYYEKLYTLTLYLFVIVVFLQQMLSLMESSGVFPYKLLFM